MERKKRLLFIVEAMGGGVFTYMVDLVNELVNSYDMYIAYGLRPQTPDDYEQYFDPRVHLIRVENFRRSICLSKDLRAFHEIREIAKRVSPDIIHMHSSKAGALGRMAFAGCKVPLFYTPHGYSFLMNDHSYYKRVIYHLIEAFCAKVRCTTISCGRGEHEETLKLTRRAAYVDNGINLAALDRTLSSMEQQSHPFTVFMLGRICEQKNPALFNQIALAMPDVHFLWIGDGELRDVLTAENIEITGWTDREAALQMSMSADVFILTSRWEGLPISLLESMYMRKPCIVSNAIGNRDVIRNRENGFICNQLDEYVSAVRFCMNDWQGVHKLVEKAYYDVVNTYNTKVMAKNYLEIYSRCQQRQRGKVLDFETEKTASLLQQSKLKI